MGEGVVDVAADHALEPGGDHVPQRRRLAEQAHVGVQAHVDDPLEPLPFAEGVDFRQAGDDEVVGGDLQARVDAVPAVVDHAADAGPAHAGPHPGGEPAGELAELGDVEVLDRQGPLPLRRAGVLAGHVGRCPHHLHAQLSGALQRPVPSRHHGSHPGGGRHAPVEVPRIDDHHAHLGRVDFPLGDDQLTGFGIAGLQVQLEHLRLGPGDRRLGPGEAPDCQDPRDDCPMPDHQISSQDQSLPASGCGVQKRPGREKALSSERPPGNGLAVAGEH